MRLVSSDWFMSVCLKVLLHFAGSLLHPVSVPITPAGAKSWAELSLQ